MPPLLRRFLPGVILLALTLSVGTVGFMLIEGWSPLDAFYASMLIVSTLGFSEYQPETLASKLLAMSMIISGVGTLYYILGTTAQTLVETQFGLRKERRMRQRIGDLKNHVIICGYGRVGQEVMRELRRENQPFVIVDPDERRIQRLIDQDIPAFQGDASSDHVLHKVGIERARAIAVCTGSDAVNVFITLSARSLNDKVYIIARAIHEDDEPKLRRAGANRSITPASLGGRRMVGLMLRPTVVDLLDVLVHSDNMQMWLEEIAVESHADLVGQSIRHIQKTYQTGVMILSIRRLDGNLITNPHPDTQLEASDVLVALGTRESLNKLDDLTG